MEGFVGGVCAQNSVRLYSLKAIERGEPLLLRILPDGPGDGAEAEAPADAGQEIAHDEGSVTVQNPCLSGGAIEVFLEPFLPAPRMIVAGDTPIAAALLRLGPELGLDAVDSPGRGQRPAGAVRRRPRAGRRRPRARRARDPARRRSRRSVRYVGLVASRKRGAAVLDAAARRRRRPRSCSNGSTRRPASTSAPARRPRSRSRSWPRSSRCAAGEHRPALVGRRPANRDRPDLRHDGRRRSATRSSSEHARRDALLLRRGLQAGVRAPARMA